MGEPTLSEDKALDLMEQCLVQGLKEWAVVTDLKARVTALEQHLEEVSDAYVELAHPEGRVALLEKSLEQMCQENRGNGP